MHAFETWNAFMIVQFCEVKTVFDPTSGFNHSIRNMFYFIIKKLESSVYRSLRRNVTGCSSPKRIGSGDGAQLRSCSSWALRKRPIPRRCPKTFVPWEHFVIWALKQATFSDRTLRSPNTAFYGAPCLLASDKRIPEDMIVVSEFGLRVKLFARNIAYRRTREKSSIQIPLPKGTNKGWCASI